MNTTDRRAALAREFAETNEQLRLLKVKASKLHAELIALKGVPSESQLSNANSAVDSKFDPAQQRLGALRQRNAGQTSKTARAQTSRKVYDDG